MKPYIYTIIRKDLPIPQQLVQLGHAAYEAGIRFEKPNDIASLITLEVENEKELIEASERLKDQGIDHHMFFEPDFGPMGYTAIASRPIFEKKERHSFRKWNLYKFGA